ncbi:hypothetical protein, partial [Brevibacterium aurantiacum]|uniref:hypothetical protein n=1 Tax=Brevibacterium aurantiacum TaxID=273384 RepID=UPI00196A40BB
STLSITMSRHSVGACPLPATKLRALSETKHMILSESYRFVINIMTRRSRFVKVWRFFTSSVEVG